MPMHVAAIPSLCSARTAGCKGQLQGQASTCAPFYLLGLLCCSVWPGGLNMARTIGDAEAGEAVTAEPEVGGGSAPSGPCLRHPATSTSMAPDGWARAGVARVTVSTSAQPAWHEVLRLSACQAFPQPTRSPMLPRRPQVCQVTLPATGARLLIGSDGLWDAVHPKVRAPRTATATGQYVFVTTHPAVMAHSGAGEKLSPAYCLLHLEPLIMSSDCFCRPRRTTPER